jgi:hypothetical protein
MSTHLQRLLDRAHIITGLAPIVPSTSTPDYVSLKGYGGMTAIVIVDNATTVTGSAITLKQATDVAGTGEKALAFDKMLANIDTAAASALTETAVTSNTFTTTAVDNKNSLYIIDVPLKNLDSGFDCVRVGTGNATAAVVSVIYVLYDPVYSGQTIDPIVD